LTGTVIYIQSSVFSEVKNEVIGIAHIQENSLIGISNPCYISEKEKKRKKYLTLLKPKLKFFPPPIFLR